MPWTPGPAAHHDGSVVVSLTDFRFGARYLADVYRTGLRLRMGWYAMPGAIGLWLWASPLRPRTGSISIWASEEHLRSFVRLPAHVEVMRRYRDRGALRSAKWRLERFDRDEVLRRAREWIAEAA